MGHCKRSEGHKCPCDHHSLSALNTICRQTGTQSGYQQSSTHRNYISQKEEHINLKKVSKFLHAAKSGSSSHHKIEGRRTPVERSKNMDHLVYTLPSSTSCPLILVKSPLSKPDGAVSAKLRPKMLPGCGGV
jgi:hypothetical protein